MSNNYFNVKKVMVAILLLFFFNLNAQDCNQPSNFVTGQKGMMHARINWFAPLPELGYEWEITLDGSTDIVQSGNVPNATVLLTGLTAETVYQLKVRSHCSVDTYSDWSLHYFTTAGTTVTQNVEIGNGADANAFFGANYGPIMYAGVATRNGSVANMLFSTTEMQGTNIPNGAQITGVAFNKVNAAHNGDGYPDLRMRLFAKNSNAAAPLSLTTTFGDLQADHTEVMDDLSFDLPETTGWIDFNFETPFTYNGGGFELATAMYQDGQVAQFSAAVIWQFTNGFKDYMIGAWPINTVPMNDALILNHQSGNQQYKNRPNIKIYYAVSNAPTALYVTTPNASPSVITQNNGSIQLFSSIIPSYVSQQVIWQIVSGAEYATLNANGLVSALDNGTVTIQAISADDATILDTIDVVISGQLPAVVSIDVTVSGDAAAAITTDNGTLQLNTLVLPAEADQNVVWSIIAGSDFASVDANGLITAIDNGTVTVQAVSVENNMILDIIDIVISNQIVPVATVEVTVTGNAAATVTTDNGTLQLNALVLPSNANQNVVWSIIAGSDFASVDTNGLLTAIDNGTVTVQAVSAEDNTILDTIDVVITNQIVPVATVEVTVADDAVATITTDNGTLQLNALVLPSNSNQNVVWSIIAGSDFASVDANGLVTAIDNGTVTIQAVSTEDNTILDTVDVVITNQIVPVETVEISVAEDAAATITTDNGTLQLNALVLPSNANQNVVWSSTSGSDFATVDSNGLVTALDNGTVTVQAVSAEDNTVLDIIDVVITNQIVPVSSLVISVENDAQPVITTSGETLQLFATVAPANSEQDVMWSIVSGSEFVSINADGLVTAMNNGTATIKAVSTENAEINDTIEIVVSGILGFDEFNREDAVIYPNPSQSLVTIQSQFEIRQIAIYSIEGRKVLETNGNTINIAGLPQSNYILIAQFENGKTITKKIVKN